MTRIAASHPAIWLDILTSNRDAVLGALDAYLAGLQSARDIVERQVKHMARLIDDLLDVSRITRGKIQLHREILPADTIVHSAVETSQPLIDAHAHTLEVSVPKERLLIEVDPARLAQVLTNLLNFADLSRQQLGIVSAAKHLRFAAPDRSEQERG